MFYSAKQKTSQYQQIPKLQEKLRKMHDTIGQYQYNIPPERDIGTFMKQVAELMHRQELTEQVVEPGKEIKAGNINCVPITMKCKGNVIQIFEFYKSLQNLKRLVRIEKVKLLSEKEFSGQVEMETNAIIYYQAKVKQG